MFLIKKIIPIILCLTVLLSSSITVYAYPAKGTTVEDSKPKSVEKDKVSDEKKLLELIENNFYLEVPLMYQTDYPHVPYDTDNVAASGCGISSLAMVATYLKDTKYTPEDLAIKYNDRGADNTLRMEYGIKDLGLKPKKTHDFDELIKGLKKGKVAIVLVSSASTFTQVGHFLVATGMTEDGKILINDPNKNNYYRDELKEGYENGFDKSVLKQGFFTAWIFPVKEKYSVKDIKKALLMHANGDKINKKSLKAKKETDDFIASILSSE